MVAFQPLSLAKLKLKKEAAMKIPMAIALLITATSASFATELSELQRAEITRSVLEFESLLECMQKTDGQRGFEFFGYGAGGFCHEWHEAYQDQMRLADNRVVLTAGYQCTMPHITMFGFTFFESNPDVAWRDEILGWFQECKEGLETNQTKQWD